MESANFHQQQHQDHQPVLDNSCYGLSWFQNPILNNTSNDTSSRDQAQHLDHNIDYVHGHNSNENFMTNELQRLTRIKDEFSNSESYPKFSEMINNSPTSSIEDLHLNPTHGYNNNQDLLLRTFQDDHISNNHYQDGSSRALSRSTFSQIFPTINVSNLNKSPSSAISSNSFDMNLPALDLFGSSRFNGNFSQVSSFNPHQVGSFFKDTCLSYGLDQMHQVNHRQVICHSKIPAAFNNRSNCIEAKRPANNYIDTKAPQATVPKKSKMESRASCAPFKVRKEKLGDRIASLQQLVAPFGKTDTASVLMEAIGYIKFLQNQVETLSVPYMKSTQKTNRLPTREVSVDDGNQDAKRDLRSRGLCLVPLSCLSYVTDGGGAVWSSP